MNNLQIFDYNGGLRLDPVDPDINKLLWVLASSDFPEKQLLTDLIAELQGFRRVATSPAVAMKMRQEANRDTEQIVTTNSVSMGDLPKHRVMLPLMYDTIQTQVIRYMVRQLENELIKNKGQLLNWEVTGPYWDRGKIDIKGTMTFLKPAEPDDKSAQIFNDIAGKYTR